MKVPVCSVRPGPLRFLLTTSNPESCNAVGVRVAVGIMKKVVFFHVVYGHEVTLINRQIICYIVILEAKGMEAK